MADGLAGHLHDFYYAVADAAWLQPQSPNAADYAKANEGLPYWFNGLVGLAYALDNDRLKDQVHGVAQQVLELQTPDGWIGPETYDHRNMRARMPFFWGLTQLVEANSTWTEPVVKALRKFFPIAHQMLANNGTGYVNCPDGYICYWGQTRNADMVMTLQWLLEKFPSDQDGLYWELMEMFFDLNTYKWENWYMPQTYPKVYLYPDTSDLTTWPYLHGVNVAEGKRSIHVCFDARVCAILPIFLQSCVQRFSYKRFSYKLV